MIGECYGKVFFFGVLYYIMDDNDDEGMSKIFMNKLVNISVLM